MLYDKEKLMEQKNNLEAQSRLERESKNEYYGFRESLRSSRSRSRDYGYTESGEYWEE